MAQTIQKLAYDGSYHSKDMKTVFAETLSELFAEDCDVVYLDADLMNSIGTLKLLKEMPERCINCGIQEANMIGVAAGLSAVGKKPYVHTFGPFASRRCFDQVFLSVGYAQNNVRIVGSDPGVSAAFNGGTHMPFEDVAMYRAIPGAMIVDTVDPVQFKAALKNTKDRSGVTYIRTPRKSCVTVYPEGTVFKEGEAVVLKEGNDAAVFACGIMVAVALQAANMLDAEGISAAVIDPYTIKPLDADAIVSYAKRCGAVVTVENANVMGGLGAAVAECLAKSCPTPVEMVGVEDRWGQVGPEDFLRQEYGLTPQNIVEHVKKAIKRK